LRRAILGRVGPRPGAAGPSGAASAAGRLRRRAETHIGDIILQAAAALDRLLSGFALETVVTDAVLPYLRSLGKRWQQSGDAVVAQEHFASALLRGRLLGLARGWGGGYGPMALLGCFPGEQHDLGLICFGVALRANGWRITFLGADTPFPTISEAARRVRPDLIVLTTLTRRKRSEVEDHLASLSAYAPVALAGAGVDESNAPIGGARFLAGDPFTAAARIAAESSASGSSAVRRRATRPAGSARREGPA